MTCGPLVGYARVSTDAQDLTAQKEALTGLRVPLERVYSDRGMTWYQPGAPETQGGSGGLPAGQDSRRDKARSPGAVAASATDIAEELTCREVRLNLGGSLYDPTDPVGRLLFNVLGMVAEFESDLIRARTREGMATAKVRGKLKGRRPKLSAVQERHMVALHRADDHTVAELVELFGVGRATVYRALERHPVDADGSVTLPRADAERVGN